MTAIATSNQGADEPFKLRDVADKILAQLGVEPTHVDAATTVEHGHGGVCCCMTMGCRGRRHADGAPCPTQRACNVNDVLCTLVDHGMSLKDG